MGRRLLEAVGAAAPMEANCECDSGDFMGDPSRPQSRAGRRASRRVRVPVFPCALTAGIISSLTSRHCRTLK